MGVERPHAPAHLLVSSPTTNFLCARPRSYYYNGLREGRLIKFAVTKLTAEDAVGASVALTGGGGGGGGAGGGNALEEVCRTRFVSARFDWDGQSVPSID